MNKLMLYSAVESITPPIIFNYFRKSSLYVVIKNIISKYESVENFSQNCLVEAGLLTGATLNLDPTGVWQKEMLTGTYDKELFENVVKLNLSGSVIYDIGSHVGFHSLCFAKIVGKQGHVYAFEPNPINCKRIEKHLDFNSDLATLITLLELALSDSIGTTEFFSTDDIENGTSSGGFIDQASTLWEKNDYLEKTGFVKSSVEQTTIDQLIFDKIIMPPHLMKIDVEGAEKLVLQGAKNTILKYRPTIVVEFHSINSTYECMSLFKELDYKTRLIKKEPDGRVLIIATQ